MATMMATAREYISRMHWHWQNLNDAPDSSGSPWVHGRAWLHLGERRPDFRVEWLHGRLKLNAMLTLDRDERSVTLSVAIPGASYHLTADGLPAKLFARLPFRAWGRDRYNYEGSERAIGIRVFDSAVWWSIWEDDNDWRCSDPKWIRGRLGLNDIAKFLFGKETYSTTVVETRDVRIPMPEGAYDGVATRDIARWSRPRLPKMFHRTRMSVNIDIPKGIGVPGKGENDYDMGDDAIYAQSTTCSTIEEAIGKVVASALRTRMRHGGSHTFTPSEVP